jgi:hypothetical protein
MIYDELYLKMERAKLLLDIARNIDAERQKELVIEASLMCDHALVEYNKAVLDASQRLSILCDEKPNPENAVLLRKDAFRVFMEFVPRKVFETYAGKETFGMPKDDPVLKFLP